MKTLIMAAMTLLAQEPAAKRDALFDRVHGEFLQRGSRIAMEGVKVETKTAEYSAERWQSERRFPKGNGNRSAVVIRNLGAGPAEFQVEAPGWFYGAFCNDGSNYGAVKRGDPLQPGERRIYCFIDPPAEGFSPAEGTPAGLVPSPAVGFMRGGYDGIHYRYDVIFRSIGDVVRANRPADSVWLGDSITHFWHAGGKDGPAKAKLFKERFGAYSVINAGMGGITVSQVNWNIVNAGFLDGYEARNVNLMIGANDVMEASTPAEIAEGVRICLKLICERQPKALVTLMSTLPRDVRARYKEPKAKEIVGKIVELNRIIRGFADGRNIVWIDLYDRYLGADGWAKAEYFVDGTHPSVRGYELWADALLEHLGK